MEGIGGEISSKIRAAIKTKLMEMGAYVDEELPDYVMVMVANKRSKAQMADDLQLFLGKSTEQFTNWLQQVLNKLQEVATVNNKTLTDTKKVQSRTSSLDEAAHKAKSASKLKCEQVAKPKPEHILERAGGHRSEKKHGTVGGSAAGKGRRVSGGGVSERAAGVKAPEAASTKMKIVLTDSDGEDEDDEDFINIKADAEAEALLKAELPMSARQLLTAAGAETASKPNRPLSEAATPAGQAGAEPRQVGSGTSGAVSVSARDVTAALAHSTSGAQKVRPTVRRVVTAPASTVTVATKRSAGAEDVGGPAKRAAVSGSEEGASRKSLASAVSVTDRLGVRQSAAPSIKDRLGTRGSAAAAAATSVPAVHSRLGSRPAARSPAAAEVGGKVTDGSGGRTAGVRDVSGAKTATSGDGRVPPPRVRVTDRLGVRRGDAAREGAGSRKRSAEGDGAPEVVAKRPTAEGAGSRLAQRLRELAEGRSARVAHVPPNNIRPSTATGRTECRPSINSQVVPAGVRLTAVEGRDRDGEVVPAVALPSVVRVTPRPRLPASLQANKNLLLKAVAEAQRSVAAAAASAAASASGTATAVASLGAGRNRGVGRYARGRLGLEPCLQVEDEEDGEQEEDKKEEEEEEYANDEEEALENPADQFTLGFLNRENFAVTVPNESGADVPEAEEQFDDGRRHARVPCEPRGTGMRRMVVTASGEPRESAEVSAVADTPQQITTRLSPEGSCDGDSSSEREDEEVAETPSMSTVVKDDTRSYDGRPVFEEEYEEEEEEGGPVAAVAAVRPTVVTTVPHMDTEPVTRTNPQFVVTLDGVDISTFPNGGMDEDDCPVDSGRTVDRDVSKADSGGDSNGGAGQSAGAPATGRATVVQRVEPRLRLGPMPSQQRQDGSSELSSAGLSSSSGVIPAKTAERCKYWPACRLGSKCTFHHPTQTCRVFPACKFGEKCLYIHPNCKFDAACTRRDCPYTHSSPRLSVAAAARGPAQPGSSAAVCRFFPSCTNPACRFLHPKACKYGRYCVKPGCTFQHEGVPTTDKLKWVCPFRA